MRIIICILLCMTLTACVPVEAKHLVRQKHAQSYVLRQRIIDKDPKNDPTPEQMKDFIKSTAKDWESMDRLLNNWEPEKAKVMQPIDLGK